jgi:hypothetical protein
MKEIFCLAVFLAFFPVNAFADTQSFVDLTFGPAEYLSLGSGHGIQISGNFWSSSTNDLWDTSAAALEFIGGGTHEMQLSSGKSGTWDSLRLYPATELNVTGTGSLYLGSLIMDPGSSLSLTGNLVVGYGEFPASWVTGSIVAGGTITINTIQEIGGGTITALPEPVSAGLFVLGAGALALVRRKTKK